MKQPKALLQLANSETFITRIISTYIAWGCGEIIVVAGKALSEEFISLNLLPENVCLAINEHPEYERFFSVKLGLNQIKRSEYCFIQNIDNPLISSDILDELYAAKSTEEIVIPVFGDKGGHPVLLNSSTIEVIRNYPQDDANLRLVLKEMSAKRIEMKDGRVLININDQSEFEMYSGTEPF